VQVDEIADRRRLRVEVGGLPRRARERPGREGRDAQPAPALLGVLAHLLLGDRLVVVARRAHEPEHEPLGARAAVGPGDEPGQLLADLVLGLRRLGGDAVAQSHQGTVTVRDALSRLR
jgi:hypothetical protein